MEKSLELSVKFKRFEVSPESTHVAFYTCGQNNISIMNLVKNKSSELVVPQSVINVQFDSNDTIIVFSENLHRFYNIYKLKLEKTTVFQKNITNIFKWKQDAHIFLKEDRLIISKENLVLEKKEIIKYQIINSSYLCVFTKEGLLVYQKNGKDPFVIKKNFDKNTPLSASIRNGKVYFLEEDRIKGHDLNIYLDVPAKDFYVLKDFLMLYDGKSKKISLFQKNMINKPFECEADDYAFSEKLFVLKDGIFSIFSFTNIFKKPFSLIEESWHYKEAEDEFDVSDSSFRDL